MCDAVKTVLRGKLIALMHMLEKKKKIICFHLQKLQVNNINKLSPRLRIIFKKSH